MCAGVSERGEELARLEQHNTHKTRWFRKKKKTIPRTQMVAALATVLPAAQRGPSDCCAAPPLDAATDAPPPRAAGASAPALRSLSAPPPDWTVKTRVTFAATAPLTVLAACAGANAAAERAALDAAADGWWREAGAAAPTPAAALATARLHWRHPATAVEPTMLAAASSAWTAVRAVEWRDALRSAYRAVRGGGGGDTNAPALPALLVLTAPSAPRPAAVLFRAAGVGGHPSPTAIVAGASVGVAAALASEHGAAAGRPLPPDAGAAPSSCRPGAPPPAALLFEGGPAVHGVFDFLYADAGAALGGCAGGAGGGAAAAIATAAARGADVPLLLAPGPFAGGALASLPLEPVPAARGRARARLRGPAPPWCVTAVAAALAGCAAAAGATLDAVAEVDARTALFNVAPPPAKGGGGGGGGDGGGGGGGGDSDAPPATDWRAAPPAPLVGCWARRLKAAPSSDGGGATTPAWEAALERARPAVGVRGGL